MQPNYFEDLHEQMEYDFLQIVLFNYLINDCNWLDVQFFVRRRKGRFVIVGFQMSWTIF
jgi:hypothetical protein